MQIDLEPGGRPFWTLPSGHFVESAPSDTGHPGHLQAISRRYVFGEMDKTTAEAQLVETLVGWSQATSDPD